MRKKLRTGESKGRRKNWKFKGNSERLPSRRKKKGRNSSKRRDREICAGLKMK